MEFRTVNEKLIMFGLLLNKSEGHEDMSPIVEYL